MSETPIVVVNLERMSDHGLCVSQIHSQSPSIVLGVSAEAHTGSRRWRANLSPFSKCRSLDQERFLALRASIERRGHRFDPTAAPPRFYSRRSPRAIVEQRDAGP